MRNTRRRIAGIAGIGALAGTSVLAGAQPAGANEVEGSASISFTDTSGRFVTCNVFDHAEHNGQELYASYSVQLVGSTGDCGAVVVGTIDFHDASGKVYHVGGKTDAGAKRLTVSTDGDVRGPITTTFAATMSTCNFGRSTTCVAVVKANPK